MQAVATAQRNIGDLVVGDFDANPSEQPGIDFGTPDFSQLQTSVANGVIDYGAHALLDAWFGPAPHSVAVTTDGRTGPQSGSPYSDGASQEQPSMFRSIAHLGLDIGLEAALGPSLVRQGRIIGRVGDLLLPYQAAA